MAGVGLREVNRAFDEEILPKEFLRSEEARHVVPGACPLIFFYYDTAHQLTSDERRFFILTVSPKLRKWTKRTALRSGAKGWIIRHRSVAVDFAPFVEEVGTRLEKLAEAEKLVVSSRDILGGTPVIKGTRIPVYDVAASVEAGIPRERLRAAYPALDDREIELAALYAKANPPRGRPRVDIRAPAGAIVLTDKRIKRRRRMG